MTREVDEFRILGDGDEVIASITRRDGGVQLQAPNLLIALRLLHGPGLLSDPANSNCAECDQPNPCLTMQIVDRFTGMDKFTAELRKLRQDHLGDLGELA